MNSSKNIIIQFQHKLVNLEENVNTFDDLKRIIRQKFDSLPDKIRIYYVDSDNDEITISCDEDLHSFQFEVKDVVINIKPYSESDATDNEDFDDEEAEEEEEDEESSCCDSDSGEERAKVAQQKSLNQNVNQIEIIKPLDKVQVQDGGNSQQREQISQNQEIKDDTINNSSFNDEFSDDDEVEEAEEKKNQEKPQNVVAVSPPKLQTRIENDQSVQCDFDSKNIEMQDQQNQAGVTLKDQEQQIYTVHCDKSYQAQVNQSDAQDQTLSAACVDNSTQIQLESKDTQSQANVESRDNSLQTVRIDLLDKKIQAKIDQCDNQIQADLIKMEDFQQQACSNQNRSLSSQPEIQVESLQEQSNQKSEMQSFMPYLERIKQLEENQAQLLKVLEMESKKFESNFQNIQQNFLSENVEDRIKQLVDNRVNELLPEFSRANWENFRRQEKISRFDRIFQEIVPKFNNLALITDAKLLNTSYDELTSTLIQKLEIARDMYLKELIQSQVNLKNHNSNISDEMIAKSQIRQQQNNVEEEEVQEESKEISNPNNQKKQQDEKIISRNLLMTKKDSRYEDDSVVEERLRQQQEKIRKEKQQEEENIKMILKEKENQALQLNQEIIENLHKDYPEEIVNKAKQIAQLTQENPNIYLQYVLDYKQLTVNDLIDQIYTTNVMERYSEK
ncbi:hypothetical protein ABPG72_004599 [Tetrahymena utriculariae]